ncbi:hypothetical protein ACLKA7_013689 [Drosophila subpalustris]
MYQMASTESKGGVSFWLLLLLLQLLLPHTQQQQQQQFMLVGRDSAVHQLTSSPKTDEGTTTPTMLMMMSQPTTRPVLTASTLNGNLNAATAATTIHNVEPLAIEATAARKKLTAVALNPLTTSAMPVTPTTATTTIATTTTATSTIVTTTTATTDVKHLSMPITATAVPIKTKRIAPTATTAATTTSTAATTAELKATADKLNMRQSATQRTLVEAWPAMKTNNISNWQIAAAEAAATTATATSAIAKGKVVPTLHWLDTTNMDKNTFGNHPVSSATTTIATSASTAATSTTATAAAGAGWPVKHAAVLEGDVILGGLMMVHSREDSITCGQIMPQGGIQALEAMLYTLDQVNKQQLLPNITLGAHLLDDCDKDTYGLEMAVDFIKDIPFPISIPVPHNICLVLRLITRAQHASLTRDPLYNPLNVAKTEIQLI